MRKLSIISFVLSCFCLVATAQVKMDNQLIFVSTDANERQIYNLGSPEDSTDAVNSGSAQTGILIFDASTDVNTIDISLTPTVTGYTAGMRINISLTNANTGAVTVNVDNKGAVPVKKNITQDLDAGDIRANQAISLMYDGTNFQLMAVVTHDCPAGFAEVNDSYCIEIDERADAQFWGAVVNCGNIDAHLCTWSSWYYACQKTGLGLNDMTGNYEWIDDGHDHSSNATSVGSGNCTFTNSSTNSDPRPYRCCYYRK
jgi:hypothetical protein